jgi:phosphoserine phosphatase
VFDNDGTLWAEQPIPVEIAFAFDRMGHVPIAPDELAGSAGRLEVLRALATTHVGMSIDEFHRIVTHWLATAHHPRFGRRYDELAYEPMLELLAYLRARGFKTYIVSGGEVEFMRAWAERVYGVPPEQVIGSRIAMDLDERGEAPVLVREPRVDLVDDHAGKVIGIQQMIGRRPIAAFGNSDGDLEMLEWTTSAPGLRLGMIVHHTDAQREWAYDRTSAVGALARALDESARRGWVVIDMKRDWRAVFAFQQSEPR